MTEITDDMIDRAARALAAASGDLHYYEAELRGETNEAGWPNGMSYVKDWREDAKAALEAALNTDTPLTIDTL